MVVFALAARMKWSVRRKALRERRRRRRESVEGNEAERLANEEESVEQKREGFEERLGEMREVQNVEVQMDGESEREERALMSSDADFFHFVVFFCRVNYRLSPQTLWSFLIVPAVL